MPTYKGIEMPANNADKIGAMIESAKNRLMGTPVGDFVRGVGEIGGIPKTIVAGTQNSYGANIPTVEGLKQNLTASVEQGNIAGDLGVGVSRIANNVNTPTAPALGAAINQPLLNMAKESSTAQLGVPVPSDGGYTPGPFAKGSNPADGGRLTFFNLNDKEMEDWKAERDRQNSIINGKNPEYLALEKERSNPNNALFKEIVDKVKDINTFMSSDPLTRKYQTLQLGALNQTLDKLAPLTSYGQLGVAGIQADTTKRGQDVRAETDKRGQDIDKEIKKPEAEAKAEEAKAKSSLYGTQAKLLEEEGKPDKVREKEVSGWLTERRKVINASLGDLEGLSDEEKTTKMNARVADFNKYNPPPIKSAKKNSDGTVTVQYADGTVKTGKPVK
jgi:hypothetical protein